MISITLAQFKSDITSKMKGTSLRQVTDFFGSAATAANRLLARISPEETRRTVTMTTPFWDNVQDYPLVSDFKQMLDIRPQANRQNVPGQSHFEGRTPRQFDERLDPNTFSIRWNNMIRTLRAQQLPIGNVVTLDSFESASSNGLWTPNGGAGNLYTEPLNYVQGGSSLGFDLDGGTVTGNIENSTAAVADLSQLRYEDTSMIFFWIPIGFSSRFTNFKLRRGESNTAYKEVTVIAKGDGTAFTDGWNFLLFDWNQAVTVGSPTNLLNTYRRFSITYTAGADINGCLIDSWTNSLGNLYEIEYYSEYMFRTSAGVWLQTPTDDSDLINVSPASYEILKAEMMIEITQNIRTGQIRQDELADWRLMLNGQPQSRYVKDPPYHGLYADYLSMYPSSAIPTVTRTYDYDV